MQVTAPFLLAYKSVFKVSKLLQVNRKGEEFISTGFSSKSTHSHSSKGRRPTTMGKVQFVWRKMRLKYSLLATTGSALLWYVYFKYAWFIDPDPGYPYWGVAVKVQLAIIGVMFLDWAFRAWQTWEPKDEGWYRNNYPATLLATAQLVRTNPKVAKTYAKMFGIKPGRNFEYDVAVAFLNDASTTHGTQFLLANEATNGAALFKSDYLTYLAKEKADARLAAEKARAERRAMESATRKTAVKEGTAQRRGTADQLFALAAPAMTSPSNTGGGGATPPITIAQKRGGLDTIALVMSLVVGAVLLFLFLPDVVAKIGILSIFTSMPILLVAIPITLLVVGYYLWQKQTKATGKVVKFTTSQVVAGVLLILAGYLYLSGQGVVPTMSELLSQTKEPTPVLASIGSVDAPTRPELWSANTVVSKATTQQRAQEVGQITKSVVYWTEWLKVVQKDMAEKGRDLNDWSNALPKLQSDWDRSSDWMDRGIQVGGEYFQPFRERVLQDTTTGTLDSTTAGGITTVGDLGVACLSHTFHMMEALQGITSLMQSVGGDFAAVSESQRSYIEAQQATSALHETQLSGCVDQLGVVLKTLPQDFKISYPTWQLGYTDFMKIALSPRVEDVLIVPTQEPTKGSPAEVESGLITLAPTSTPSSAPPKGCSLEGAGAYSGSWEQIWVLAPQFQGENQNGTITHTQSCTGYVVTTPMGYAVVQTLEDGIKTAVDANNGHLDFIFARTENEYQILTSVQGPALATFQFPKP